MLFPARLNKYETFYSGIWLSQGFYPLRNCRQATKFNVELFKMQETHFIASNAATSSAVSPKLPTLGEVHNDEVHLSCFLLQFMANQICITFASFSWTFLYSFCMNSGWHLRNKKELRDEKAKLQDGELKSRLTTKLREVRRAHLAPERNINCNPVYIMNFSRTFSLFPWAYEDFFRQLLLLRLARVWDGT